MVDAWMLAQTMERDYWQSQFKVPVTDEQTLREAATRAYAIWTRFGVPTYTHIGSTIIDIGCGPTSRLACFAGAKIVGIDPLVEDYQRMVPALMATYAELHAAKAEDRILGLEQTADLVACINCLDHCSDPSAVLANMHAYCKPDGVGVLSVDCSEHTEEMHPSRMMPKQIDELLLRSGWTIERSDSGMSYPHMTETGEVSGWEAGWSPGVVAYHWTIRRR